MKFIPAVNVNYAIYIKQGERTYQQEIGSVTANRSNTIELKTPYEINAGQDLIISIYARKYSRSNGPAYVDNGPAVHGKGNLISFDGNQWEYLKDEENDNNFIISATVTSKDGKLADLRSASTEPIAAFPVITGYNIYKNQKKLVTVPTSTRQFTDRDVTAGTHSYSVSTLYDLKESNATKAVSEVTVSSENISVEEDINVYPTLFKHRIQVKNHRRIKSIEIYSADGKMVRKINDPIEWIDAETMPKGVYFFKLTTDKAVKTVRGIKQ